MTKLKGYTAHELLEQDFGTREVILEPWLRAEETAVIWAGSGVGKTWVSLSIALAVAGGGSVGDWTAPKALKGIYFDGEMHQGDLQERIRGLLDTGAVEVPDLEKTLRNLKIIPRQAQEIGQDFYDLTDKEHHKAILELIQGEGAELVIFDNLTTMSEGLENENDAAEFKTLQALFMQMKTAGVAAILIHHSNKTQKQMRGSTALETTFEVIIGLCNPKSWLSEGATFVVEFTKFRGNRDERTRPKEWKLSKGQPWEISDAEPEEARDLPAVVALRSMKFINQTEIAKALKVDPGTVSRQLNKAKGDKVLTEADIKEWFKLAKEEREAWVPEEELVF